MIGEDVGYMQRSAPRPQAGIVVRPALTVYIQVVRFGPSSSARIMSHTSLRRWILRSIPALSCVAALGCSTAPVQEMSNARQAIRAARDAGADKAAPQTLTEAQALLEQAEASLQRRSYREARRNAVSARSKATEALGAVQPALGRIDRTG